MHMYHNHIFPQILNVDDIGQKLYQWRCQSLGTSQKEEQQDVYVRQQEADCKDP